ncbi:MAG: glycosyltransferase family 25 protein [Candidatus Paceibacterota bacterium]
MSIKYYIVTLQHEEERVNWVKSHIIPNIKTISTDLSNSNISIYFGVDGRRMSIPEITWWINNNYLPENYKINPAEGIPFRQGQIGCALSHIRIWEEMYLNKIPHVCILEDDAKINQPNNQLNNQESNNQESNHNLMN